MLIIGLGNPGGKYDGTRHNVGFAVLDALAEDLGETWKVNKKFKAEIIETQLNGKKAILAKPLTFMNASGEAAQALKQQYKTEEVIVVYDDVTLEFGKLRIRKGGSSGGHNGVKSLTKHIGEDYWRIKIGVGSAPEKMPLEKWVLSKFDKKEISELHGITRAIVEKIKNQEIEEQTF